MVTLHGVCTALRRFATTVLVAFGLLLGVSRMVFSSGATEPSTQQSSSLLPYMLLWLLPLGVALVATGTRDPLRAQRVATSLPLAIATAMIGYYVCGFAFQYGGLGLIVRAPNLQEMVAEWSPLDLRLGSGWGLIGLRGFALPANLIGEDGLVLFVHQLPLVTTAALIPLVPLEGRLPRLSGLALALLISCVCYPLVGNWLRGGGWLSQLGTTLGWGHGFVDYGFSSSQLVGAGVALAALLAYRCRRPVPSSLPTGLPASYLPLNVLVGSFLALVGWLAMVLSQPLVPEPSSSASLVINALMAVAASSLATLSYGWLARGEPDPALTGRGLLAALAAVGPALAFVPAWSAALIGGIAGLLLAPCMHVIEHVLRLEDDGAVLSVHGLATVWGLVAVGLFADGHAGQNWNVSASSASNAVDQGVAGLLATPSAGTGQLLAQLVGALAVVVLTALIPWITLTLIARMYGLPSALREAARERALRSRLEREAAETRRRRGLVRAPWRRLWSAWLHADAAAALRLRSRRRRMAP